jgi:hypothetical protein
MKKPTQAEMQAAKAAADERIARAEARIREGNMTRDAAIADCEKEKKKSQLARDAIGALAWSLTAMGLGQTQKPASKKK